MLYLSPSRHEAAEADQVAWQMGKDMLLLTMVIRLRVLLTTIRTSGSRITLTSRHRRIWMREVDVVGEAEEVIVGVAMEEAEDVARLR